MIILTEFTKRHFNAQIYIGFPSLGLVVKSDGFGIGIGFSINYLWHTQFGAFYLGGLFDFSVYESLTPGISSGYTPNGYPVYITKDDKMYDTKNTWFLDYTWALNLGYKFVLSSGVYFNTGGNIGAKWQLMCVQVFTALNFSSDQIYRWGTVFRKSFVKTQQRRSLLCESW